MASIAMRDFRVVQGCPAFVDVAPCIAIVVNDAKATVNSIYRGQDAAQILHKHGKHTQAELYDLFVHHHGPPANKPGFSTHELKSDGVAYGIPRGRDLEWWMQGFDVNDRDVGACIRAANAQGWHLWQPYPDGREFHHLNFSQPPHWRTTSRLGARIWRLRATLPRS